MLLYQREKAGIELGRMKRNEADADEIVEQEDMIDRLDYEILLLKRKLGLLGEEEALRLKELETKFKMDEESKIEQVEEVNNE